MSYFFSLLFLILIVLWGAIIPIIYSPTFITRNTKMADHGAKIWSVFSLWMLKKLCHIDHKVVGLQNIPQGACIVACKHQSMWETIVMHLLFRHPVYVYKKELEKIPFYGWYLKVMSGIKLNRKGGAGALKDLIRQTKTYLSLGQSVVLFPQGTRTPFGAKVEDYPYQSGIAALYLACNVPVVPVALNSGKFWPKHLIKKTRGTITIEFLKPIEPGLSKQEFMAALEKSIEERSKELEN